MRFSGTEILALGRFLSMPLVPTFAFALAFAPAVWALPGDLEIDFSPLPAGSSSVEVLDVDSQGRILVLAKISNLERRLLRFLPGGSPDPAFQEPAELGGRTTTAAFFGDDTIVAAGHYTLQSQDVAAVHLLADGSLDPAFSLETSDTLTTSTIHVLPDNRFWLVGQFFNDLLEGSFIAAHAADGTLIDRPFINREGSIRATFTEPDGSLVYALRFNGERSVHRAAPDGTPSAPFPTPLPEIQFLNALVPSSDGTYLGGGFLRNWPSPDIAQLYRSSPGSGGGNIPLLAASTGRVELIALDHSGRLLVSGIATVDPHDLSAQPLVRFEPEGTLDFNFHATFSGLSAAVQEVTSLRVLASGSILAGLGLADGSAALVQLSGGDPPVSAPEIVYLSPGIEARQYQELTLQVWARGFPVPAVQWRKDGIELPGANGNTLHIDSVQPSDAGAYTAAVSNGSGSLVSPPLALSVRPPVPGDLDTRSISPFEAGSVGQIIGLPDGRMLLRGSMRSNGAFHQILRLEPDGSLDPTFAAPRFDTPSATSTVVDLALAADGSILVAYELFENDGFEPTYPVVRLHPDGSFDRLLNVPDCCETTKFLVVLDDGSFLAEWDFNPRWFDAEGRALAWVEYAESYHQSPGGALVVYAGQPGDYPSGPGLYEIDVNGDRDALTYVPLAAELNHLRVLPNGSMRALREEAGTWRVASFTADGSSQGEVDTGLETILRAEFGDEGAARIYGQRDDAGATVKEIVTISGDLGTTRTIAQTGDLTGVSAPGGFHFAPDDTLWAAGSFSDLNGFASVGFARFYTGFQVAAPPEFSVLPRARQFAAGALLHLRSASLSWPRPSYQWFRNGAPLAGASGPVLYLPQTDFSDGGRYSVTISNELGSVQSPPASVVILRGFIIVSHAAGVSRLRLATVPGRQYHLERNAGLEAEDWIVFESFPGDGEIREVMAESAGAQTQFYRGRVERED